MRTITRLIFSGRMDRFPNLNFSFFEGGCGWVPFLMTQLDNETKHRSFGEWQKKSGIRLQRKPSEYFDRFFVSDIANDSKKKLFLSQIVIIAHLLGEPGVAGLHDTNGRWDLLAELRAPDLAELAATLERVRLIKGIAGTETSIHLQTYRRA